MLLRTVAVPALLTGFMALENASVGGDLFSRVCSHLYDDAECLASFHILHLSIPFTASSSSSSAAEAVARCLLGSSATYSSHACSDQLSVG